MNIVVCLKYGIDVDEIKIDPETLEMHTENAPRKFGAYDYNALVEAARLGEADDRRVHIIVFGPESARDGLKEAMAMGADKATLVIDPLDGVGGTMVSVEVVARTVEKLGGFDLILCGEASIDGASYQFAPRLAERLQVPHLVYANRLRVEGGFASVDRNIADRSETLRAPLPAVVSVTEEINAPTKPTLMQVLKAREKVIEVWSVDDIGLLPEELMALSGGKLLKAYGIQQQRKMEIWEGLSPEEGAAKMIELFESKGLMKDE